MTEAGQHLNVRTLAHATRVPHLTRRGLFIAGGGAFTAWLAARAFPHRAQILDSARFMIGRTGLDYEKLYNPPNPDQLLPRDASDRIFDSLQLGERYPKTITKDTFFVIAQKPARLASLYFYPKEGENNEAGFSRFCESFFGRMRDVSDEMRVDFIATLLMFQISGDATPSVRAQRQDVSDERMRVGLSIAENILGPGAAPTAIDVMRALEMGSYYPWARLEGPVTMGIHDIEIIMIVRGLSDLAETLPEEWNKMATYLQKRSPRFYKELSTYRDLYEDFEKQSKLITETVSRSPQIQEYLRTFYTQDKLRELLATDGRIDSYQFSRTTVYWAIISELEQLYSMKFSAPHLTTLERQALDKTIDYYLNQGSPTGFFLDQINNPKIMGRLESDARAGNKTASRLVKLCQTFESEGDKIIAADRSIASALVEEKTESDLEFQMLTGVACARWLLNDVRRYDEGKTGGELTFDDPDKLAYYAFLANSNRESAPTYQMAGTRPLHRATLPFARPEVLFETIDKFITQVYRRFEQVHPSQDFQTFSVYFLNLFEEAYFRHMLGVPRYQLDPDALVSSFIEAAEKFGAYRNLITPPHCSWMRSLEATAGYIAAMSASERRHT